MFLGLHRIVVFVPLIVWSGAAARAQCLDWQAFPHTPADANGFALALAVHDDGTGSALYFGGEVQPGNIRRFDGTQVSNVGSGLQGTVRKLVSFDDGTGAALYASGQLGLAGAPGLCWIARWDGIAWSTVGTPPNGDVMDLVVHDDGTGPALFACGRFTQIGGVQAGGVAKWNGTTWSVVGPVPGFLGGDFVMVMASYDNGTGPALLVKASVVNSGWHVSHGFAQWKNGTWSTVAAGPDGGISDMLAWDDGSGPSVFISGAFDQSALRRFDGTAWHVVGNLAGFSLRGLAVLDLGTGPRLCVGFAIATGSAGIACWNGSAFSFVLGPPVTGCNNLITYSFAMYDDGSGPRAYAGTSPGALGGGPSSSLYRLQGTNFEPIGSPQHGTNGWYRAAQVHDDGSGPAVYVGGDYCSIHAQAGRDVARFDGAEWQPVGNDDLGNVYALASFDAGAGPMLFASGTPGWLRRHNGTGWTTEGASNGTVFAMKPFAGRLYVGGSFTSFGPASPNIVSWTPSTGFQVVGSGPLAGVNGAVNALATYDDGQGLALYAGGTFTNGNGTPVSHIGRWNGTSWAPLGSGANNLVDALAVFDDGSGPALYAGGTFSVAGGVPASCVARWDGSSWSAVGAGLNAQVLSLGVFDDGSGPALYAGGNFTMSGNTPVNRLARWNGTGWSQVGAAPDGPVWALESFDDGVGIGPKLFVAGDFQHVGIQSSRSIAAWRGCGGTISKFCFGDGSVAACPCSNEGLPGRGCDNSLSTGGARLNAVGTTSPDTIELHAAGELPNAPTLVFQASLLLTSANVFGDGLRCSGGSIKRMYTTTAFNGAITVPGAGQPSISARSAALGDPLVPGTVRCYQAWYRDPNLSFCAPPSGNAWNLSNAVRIVW